MERDSVIIYRSYINAGAILKPAERLELYEAIFQYAFDGIEEEHKPIVASNMALIKPQIDANNKRYTDGKRGGRPPKNASVSDAKREKMIERLEDSIRSGANSVSFDK